MSTRPDNEPTNDDLLSEYLRGNDAPCPICGYNLRSLPGDVCPECGQRFALRIGSVEPRFGFLLIFLAPMIMAAGVALIFVIFSVLEELPPLYVWGPYLIMAAGLTEALAMVLLYRKRRLFMRQSKKVQLQLALIAWCLNIMVFIIAFKYGT